MRAPTFRFRRISMKYIINTFMTIQMTIAVALVVIALCTINEYGESLNKSASVKYENCSGLPVVNPVSVPVVFR